jgi:hypothetical protein
MGSIKYIDYNSRSILFLDFEGALSEEDVVELAEKAKRLIRLGSRTKTFVPYNLADVVFTRKVLSHVSELMAHAPMIERRAIFGVDPKYDTLVGQLLKMLKVERMTKLGKDYTEAVNILTDDAHWQPERRTVDLPVAEDKRTPPKVYSEKDFLDMGIGEGRLIMLTELEPPED